MAPSRHICLFHLRDDKLCPCGEIGDTDHYVFSCSLTESYHLPLPRGFSVWPRRILRSKFMRAKIFNCIKISNDLCSLWSCSLSYFCELVNNIFRFYLFFSVSFPPTLVANWLGSCSPPRAGLFSLGILPSFPAILTQVPLCRHCTPACLLRSPCNV